MGRALNVIGVPTGAATYTAALEGLTSLNESLLRAAPETPPLYAAGVRYTDKVSNQWRNCRDALDSRTGDCECLAPWRAAELRVSGEDPGASVLVYQTGKNKYHAVVLHGDGTIEDPSIALGMKAPRGLVDRYAQWNQAIDLERSAVAAEYEPAVMGAGSDDVACVGIGPDVADGVDELSFGVEERDAGGRKGYRGHARIPIGGGRAIYAMTSTAPNQREAERRAAAVVGAVGSAWDDVAVLVAPFPQTAAAVRLAQNSHVQNLARAAYGKVHRGHGGGGQGGKHVAFHRPAPMDPGATAADVSDPAFLADQVDQVDVEQADGYYPPDDGAAGSGNRAFDEIMTARADDEATSGVYGFGATPSEQECLDQINGYLAANSNPIVGATSFRQQGGAGFRTFQTPTAPASRPIATTRPPGGAWAQSSPGYVPPAAPPGVPGMSPYAGPIWSPFPFATGRAAPPPGVYNPYGGGGGFSSTGTPYGPLAALRAAQQGGGGGGGGGGDFGGGGGGDFGGGGGGGYYPSDPYGGGGYADPNAFFGGNDISQEDKAAYLESYGSGG